MFRHAIFSQHGLGQRKIGVENTPKILSNHMVRYINKHYIRNYDNFNQNLKALYNCNKNIDGKRINIGGDHSMTIATGAYSLNKYNNTKFIWIDAHADINTMESSNTGNIHGMPLGFLTSHGKTNMFPFINNKLRYDNLIYIGLRDMDDYESKLIYKYNIPVIRSSEANNNTKMVCDILKKMCADSPVHISFDVDALDPRVIFSTGTPVSKGLRQNSATKIIKYLNENLDVINMDVCELNLNIGSDKQTKMSLSNTLNILAPLKIFIPMKN